MLEEYLPDIVLIGGLLIMLFISYLGMKSCERENTIERHRYDRKD